MPARFFTDKSHDLSGVESELALLQGAGIETYEGLYALLRNEHADVSLRRAAVGIMYKLAQHVDKRRAVPALLAALRSADDDIRWHAVGILGIISGKRALPHLLDLVIDKNEQELLRAHAINTVHALHEPWATGALRRIVFDESDLLGVRIEALEWSSPLPPDDYIALLSHTHADLRFWAAFRLNTLSNAVNLLPAYEKLDHMVAFDTAVPAYWGWRVDREAVAALERIRFAPHKVPSHDDADFELRNEDTWLITPSLEYERYLRAYREWTPTWRYTTMPAPPVEFQVTPQALKLRLEAAWEGISFTLPRPVQSAYTLEWAIPVQGQTLIGGLHRDGHTVVCTGNDHAVFTFAAWYRQTTRQSPLYLYPWADQGIVLRPGITAAEIAKAVEQQYDVFRTEQVEPHQVQ